MFDGPEVKALKKQVELIGGMVGQAHVGFISAHDLADVIGHDATRESMQQAYHAAAAAVGEKKAQKVAVSTARSWADAYARQGPSNYGDVAPAAERAVRQMIGI